MPTRFSLSTLRGGLVVAGFAAVFSLVSPLLGATVVSDPFTDGSRSNTTGGDPQGLVYYMSSTANTAYVTNDAAGIGTGNALFLSPAAGFGKWLAQFNEVTLTNGGDLLTLQFNIRFPQGATNLSQGLRVGLYQTFGTTTIADGSTANRNDDVGYGFYSNPGTNASTTYVHGEAPGNDILGGGSPSFPTNFGTAGASFDFGTAAHLALLQIYRFTNGDLGVSARIDSGTVATGLVAAASVMTYSFNELGIALGNAVVPFLLDNVSVTTTSTNITVPVNDFDALRLKWWEALTGGTNYDLADSLVRSRIGTITNAANTQWNNMDKSPTRTYLWPDLTSTTDSGELSSAYSRIRQMALAWSTYGSSLRSNATLAADIQGALNWMFTNRYNPSKAIYDNWYDFEIGVPINLTDIAVLMYDGLGLAGLSNSLAAVEKFTPSATTQAPGGTTGTFTGANRADKIRAVAVRGTVVKDSAKLTAARDALSELFLYVTSGDGFFTDGSFLQHNRHPYNGSYGAVLLADMSLLMPWLQNSPWQCVDANQANVFQWVYDSYEPFLYKGAMMNMVCGRAISRSSSQDHSIGAGILLSILRLSESAPANDAARMRSLVKYSAQVDTFRSFSNNIPLPQLTLLRAVMNDTNTAPRGELLGHWTFGGMDRAVHLRPGWGFALSLSSSRIYNYESINTENLHGWFTGDGVTYLYNNDLSAFSDDYWPTVDPYRLPGTTVGTIARTDSSGQSTLSTKNWAGGAMLSGGLGAAGMELDAYSSSLTAKKSWFMFDNEVVCLGAGITSTNSYSIETTVENRKISAASTNYFTADGNQQSFSLGWSTNFTGASWAHLGGAGGYYFPGGANVNALREARTNSWSEINIGGSTNPLTKNYLTLWLDHGVKPTNATYSYVLLPNFSASEVSAYAAAPGVEVLANSTNVQAAKKTSANIIAANFWNDGTRTVDLITVNKKSAVLTRETPIGLEVAVADPTQANSGSIVVTLNRAATSVQFADAGVTVNQLSPTIQLTVNVASAAGKTFSAKFNYSTNAPPSFAPVANRAIDAGESFTLASAVADTDLPYQTPFFLLLASPAGMVLDSASGVLTWTPTVGQSASTNLVTLKVTDDGVPPLSATNTFYVIVNGTNHVALTPSVSSVAGGMKFNLKGMAGRAYSVEMSEDLVSWEVLPTGSVTNATGLIQFTDAQAKNFSQRFYRAVLQP